MKKIGIGNNINIKMGDCIIETEEIKINAAINENFNFNIVRDGIIIKTIEFPLDGKTLSKGDILDNFGIYRAATDEHEEYTGNQLIAFQDMSNIHISKADFNVEISNKNAILKLYYYKSREIDSQIYVLNKNEELIAVLNKTDENPIFNPRIRKTQNAESIFTFSISPNNPKWNEIKNPENLYSVDGMVFSTNFEGCFQENISESNEDIITITAYERQKLLSRKYVRAWNSEDGFETIDTFMVVILSGGKLELKNNDLYVESSHLPGTSGYVLDALLFGTDWKTGTCDVEGVFDFETDQIDIYENILKVQQTWGGILVFDSLNKIVHHRDETKWLPYDGYEVKYQKNMQSLEKLYNNKIITKLCPLGEGGLNIKSVNNNSEWLTNFSYTDSVLEGIENNPDITEPEQLKKWGERKLKDLCKPRKELTVQAVLLYQVEGYELEEIDLNHIVDVINYNGIDGDIEQLRVVGCDYSPWDFSDAILELSDITLESTDIFKKTVSASNSINNGTLNSKKIVDFLRGGKTVSEIIRETNEMISSTKSDLKSTDEGFEAYVKQTNSTLNTLSGTLTTQSETIEKLQLTIDGLKNELVKTGGSNLIRNSVGAFENEYWEGTIQQYIDTDVRNNTESKSSIRLNSGNILQKVENLKNGTYNISFSYKKLLELSTVKVIINGVEETLSENGYWKDYEKEITIIDHNFSIKFNSTDNAACLISDLILVPGPKKTYWSQNRNETNTETVKIGEGIQVDSTKTNTYHRIDSDGNRTYNKNTGQVVNEATDKGTVTEELVVRGQGTINVLLIQEIDNQAWLTGIGG